MSLEIGESSHIQWHFFAFWVEKMGSNTFSGGGRFLKMMAAMVFKNRR